MEELLTNAFSTGDLKIIVVAAILYVIIYMQRKDTKNKRDEDRDNLDKRVSLIENEIQEIKNLDLASKLAQIQTDLSWIKEKLK
jgi:hypothetical protein